jgi:hypothetical protein
MLNLIVNLVPLLLSINTDSQTIIVGFGLVEISLTVNKSIYYAFQNMIIYLLLIVILFKNNSLSLYYAISRMTHSFLNFEDNQSFSFSQIPTTESLSILTPFKFALNMEPSLCFKCIIPSPLPVLWISKKGFIS